MAQSVEATQEIHLEDIVEMRDACSVRSVRSVLPLQSSVEVDDADILEEESLAKRTGPSVAQAAALEEPAEDLAATRIQISRVTTAVMATLRVPALTLAQAMSALRATDGATARGLRVLPWLRARFDSHLPAPILASISAAVAALVVGSAALAATHSPDDSVSIQIRVAEREEPQSASKAMRRKYVTSEQLGRWSEVPTFVADVSVASLPKR